MQVRFINTTDKTVIFHSPGLEVKIPSEENIVLHSDDNIIEISVTSDETGYKDDSDLFKGYYNFIVEGSYKLELSQDNTEIYLSRHRAFGEEEEAYVFVSVFSRDVTLLGVRYKTVDDAFSRNFKKRNKSSKRFEKILDFFFLGPFEISLLFGVIAFFILKNTSLPFGLIAVLIIGVVLFSAVIIALLIGDKLGNLLRSAIRGKRERVSYKGYQSCFDSEYVAYRIEKYYRENAL